MKRLVLVIVATLGLSACVPVMDPGRWDPTGYCQSYPADPVCK
jgi:Prokaryotic membrane lipoprotein lipid attachment site